MHNIKDLRKDLIKFKKKLSDRNFDLSIDLFKSLDEDNRKLITKKEKLEQEKKSLSRSADKSNFEKSKLISQDIIKISREQLKAQEKLNNLLYILPNLALDDVPIGKDDKSNILVEQFGTVKKFSFKPKSHTEIGSIKDNIDFQKPSLNKRVIKKNIDFTDVSEVTKKNIVNWCLEDIKKLIDLSGIDLIEFWNLKKWIN